MEATERNEVKGFGSLEPLQTIWHGAIVTQLETWQVPHSPPQPPVCPSQTGNLCPIHRSFIAMSGPRVLAIRSDSISTIPRIPVGRSPNHRPSHPPVLRKQGSLCPIHRSFIAMSGPRILAVHSDSISTIPRIPVGRSPNHRSSHPPVLRKQGSLCPIHRSFIAMSGPRILAVHSDSISTIPRISGTPSSHMAWCYRNSVGNLPEDPLIAIKPG